MTTKEYGEKIDKINTKIAYINHIITLAEECNTIEEVIKLMQDDKRKLFKRFDTLYKDQYPNS